MKTPLFLAVTTWLATCSTHHAQAPLDTLGKDPANIPMDGFILEKGAVYLMRNGHATPLSNEISIRITTNGVVGTNGQVRFAKAGSLLTFDGEFAPLPEGMIILTAAEAAELAAEEARNAEPAATEKKEPAVDPVKAKPEDDNSSQKGKATDPIYVDGSGNFIAKPVVTQKKGPVKATPSGKPKTKGGANSRRSDPKLKKP